MQQEPAGREGQEGEASSRDGVRTHDLLVCNFVLWPSGAQAQVQREQTVGFSHD